MARRRIAEEPIDDINGRIDRRSPDELARDDDKRFLQRFNQMANDAANDRSFD